MGYPFVRPDANMTFEQIADSMLRRLSPENAAAIRADAAKHGQTVAEWMEKILDEMEADPAWQERMDDTIRHSAEPFGRDPRLGSRRDAPGAQDS